MTGPKTSMPTCPSCGAEVPPDAPRGYCLKCLFALGVAEPDSPSTDPAHHSAFGTPHSGIGSRSFGDYELLEEIARGGMGIVFKARQTSLGRIVAVKMLLFGDQSGKDLAQRFSAEAAVAASLQHPNIVAMHEVGAYAGQPFFAMDFIEGQSLARLSAECEVRNTEWLRRAARYVKIVAEAIEYAHERGILHRDLKPSNVLIDPFDQPIVTDFGLAKRLYHDSELTLSGQVLGSPNYMPPEQAAARRGLVGRRSDVYSLGAILYHLLTGRPPFVGETLTDTLQDVVNKEPVAPRLLNPAAPRDLETLCLKCLEKEPARRYQTAQALAEDLDRFLRNEAIHARPIGPAAKVWRWCGRKPALASFVTATIVLVLAVAVGSPIAIYQIDYQRGRAERGELDARKKAYASDMNVAQQAIAQNNFGRAQSLLDRHRPVQKTGLRTPKSEFAKSAIPSTDYDRRSTDLRGWEWRHLWQYCQSQARLPLCQQANPIFSLSASPDGKRVAIGEQDEGMVSIWDLETRKETIRFPADAGPALVTFSPRGSVLAFASGVAWPSSNQRHRVWVWDGHTQGVVVELRLEGPCRGLAFSGDGQTLATLSAGTISADPTGQLEQPSPIHLEGQLTLWKIPEGTRLAHLAGPVRWQFGSPFVVAPDLSVAAYASMADTIRLVDLRTGLERWSQTLPEGFVTALAISPDGKVLASGGGFAPSPIRLWDIASGKARGISESHSGYVSALVFWPDGKTLASGGSDQTIRLWATDGLRPLRTLLGHKRAVSSLAILPDNKTLVSGCDDGSVLVWDTAANPRASPHVTLAGDFMAWSFSTNSQTIFTCDAEGGVAQWEGSPLAKEPLFTMGGDVAQAAFLPHHSIVLARLRNGNIEVWNLQTRSLSRVLLRALSPPTKMLCMAQGNRLVIGGLASETLQEFDLTSWQKRRTWPGPTQLYSGALSPDGRWAVALGYGGAGMITDLSTDRTRVVNFQIRDASEVTFSADGKLLAASSHRGFVRILDGGTQQGGPKLGVSSKACTRSPFHPTASASQRSDGKEAIKLWDVKDHEELLTLEGQGTEFSHTTFLQTARSLVP